MESTPFSDWELIGGTLNVLQECTAIHFFNCGKSALLVKGNDLYAYGENHPCIMNKHGNGTGYFVPFKIWTFNGIKGISTGNEHVALLDQGGKVYCWGKNDFGQLGDGGVYRRTLPNHISMPEIKKIVCGPECTLALDVKNEVWFWGKLHSAVDKFQIPREPEQLALPSNSIASQISCGGNFASIVTTDGKVLTWGFNECGQLGHGHRNPVEEPCQITRIKDILAVICAANSAIFLTKDSRIFVTGRTGQSAYSVLPTEVKFNRKIVTISSCWKLDQFAVKDENAEIFHWGFHDNTGLPKSSKFKEVNQVYSNICTPNVYSKINNEQTDGLTRSNIKSVKKPDKGTQKKNNDTGIRSYLENWCDVKVRLSDGHFQAHSRILKNGSRYFKVMLEVGQNKKELDLTDLDAATCRTFFKFIYTNKLDSIELSCIPQLYQMADGEESDSLRDKCAEIWHKGLSRRNVVTLYNLAFKHNAERLKAMCAPILCQFMKEIVTSDEFKKLSNEIKLAMISTTDDFGQAIARKMFLGF